MKSTPASTRNAPMFEEHWLLRSRKSLFGLFALGLAGAAGVHFTERLHDPVPASSNEYAPTALQAAMLQAFDDLAAAPSPLPGPILGESALPPAQAWHADAAQVPTTPGADATPATLATAEPASALAPAASASPAARPAKVAAAAARRPLPTAANSGTGRAGKRLAAIGSGAQSDARDNAADPVSRSQPAVSQPPLPVPLLAEVKPDESRSLVQAPLPDTAISVHATQAEAAAGMAAQGQPPAGAGITSPIAQSPAAQSPAAPVPAALEVADVEPRVPDPAPSTTAQRVTPEVSEELAQEMSVVVQAPSVVEPALGPGREALQASAWMPAVLGQSAVPPREPVGEPAFVLRLIDGDQVDVEQHAADATETVIIVAHGMSNDVQPLVPTAEVQIISADPVHLAHADVQQDDSMSALAAVLRLDRSAELPDWVAMDPSSGRLLAAVGY